MNLECLIVKGNDFDGLENFVKEVQSADLQTQVIELKYLEISLQIWEDVRHLVMCRQIHSNWKSHPQAAAKPAQGKSLVLVCHRGFRA